MINLTSKLLDDNISYNYKINEIPSINNTYYFDNGIEQVQAKQYIPSYQITISYRGLTYLQFTELRAMYETNNAITFLCDFDIEIDQRSIVFDSNALTYIMGDFNFTVNHQNSLFQGYITVYSSVFFNYDKYQNIFEQESKYDTKVTTDRSFINIIESICCRDIKYTYLNNNLKTMINNSYNLQLDKNGLYREWEINFLLNKTDFLTILEFYREHAYGETFGYPELGIPNLFIEYIENQDDYIETGYFANDYSIINQVKFLDEGLEYEKNIYDLYDLKIKLREVKN